MVINNGITFIWTVWYGSWNAGQHASTVLATVTLPITVTDRIVCGIACSKHTNFSYFVCDSTCSSVTIGADNNDNASATAWGCSIFCIGY